MDEALLLFLMTDQLMSKTLLALSLIKGELLFSAIEQPIKTMDHVQTLTNNPAVIQLILQSLIDLLWFSVADIFF